MRTVSDLLALTGAKLSSSANARKDDDQTAKAEKATFADLGARIGEDNEVLRNLLIDTSQQLSTIDELKDSFNKLVEPLGNVLTKLEHERAEHASARGALAAIRTSHDTLRNEFQNLEKKTSTLTSETDRLGRELQAALNTAQQLGDEKVKLSGEIEATRTAMAMLTKQLGEETGSVRLLNEEKGLLTRRADLSDKKAATLDSELAHTRERLSLLENDKNTLQAALDKTLAESSRVSRRLATSESALADTRTRMQQVESSLAAAEAERNKLAAALDEANERRQSEVYALELKLDALKSHSDAAEKLLAGTRETLAARAEDVRAAEAKLLEATIAKSEAEARAEKLGTLADGRDKQIKKHEQDVASLSGRGKVLSETLASTETSLAHANEKIKVLSAQVEQLQADAATNRAKAEEDFVQLNATIEHERAERGFAEGALESLRGDYARLQRQMSEERSIRRRDHQRRAVRTPTAR